MVIYKQKKNVRQRGDNSHGWGSKKKHRGAGNRGGHGLAGSGKRGDAKKPRIWKIRKYFGKHGFKPHGLVIAKHTINLSILEKQKEKLLQEGKIKEENGTYTVNLEELGYTKLLGKGDVESTFTITVPMASFKALEKVKSKGGSVTLTAQDVEESTDKEQTPKEE